MRLSNKRSILFFFLVVSGFFRLPLLAQDVTKIKNINEKPYNYRNDVVIVEGEVFQYIDEKTKYSKVYYLKDEWGDGIKVITDVVWPKINARYKIKGILVINDQEEIILVEKEREPDKPEMPPPPEYPDPVGEDRSTIYYLIVAAALLLIIIVTLAVVMISGKKRVPYITTPIPGLSDMSYSTFSNPEPKILETPTIKIAAPPSGTLKLLPGHLEVVDGDDKLKEIRFYKIKNQEEAEITFGRGSGPTYTHVQLKPMTVSLKQAKLIYTNGKYVLINYAAVNPTMVNTEPLPKDGSVTLEEGNKIVMGEVSFIFHEK